ncbi:MAG: SDR family NAD(P)-dependent oxidoreductase [Euzebya sp.]
MTTKTFTRALVTGASSGIGQAFARHLAADGVDLVIVARRTALLDALAKELEAQELDVQVEVITADLLDPDDLLRVSTRLGQGPPIDLLVNNAGFGSTRPFAASDLDTELGQVQIHIEAMMTLTHAALNAMSDRHGGGILNVSSMGGFQPLPNGATYAACKAFETSFTESVRLENASTGIHLTALCPGFVDTAMVQGDASLSKMPKSVLLTAQRVAREGLDGVAENKAVVIPGMAWKAAAALTDSLPRSATRLLMAGVNHFR